MKEQRKVPRLRFPNFLDEWKQRKLCEVCDYVDYRGKTPAKVNNGIFLVTAKNVKNGYIDYEASKEYISEKNYEKTMHRGKPEIGDVLITTEAPCGNVAQVDRPDIALAQRIIKYRGHKKIINNTYLKQYMLSPVFQKFLLEKSTGGTVQGIKGSVLHQLPIMIPSFTEQTKIGKLLDELDNLIALHQHKYDFLKELKKAMLQKMFPKEGESVPEVRFPGFTDDWEEHKLTEFVDFYNGLTYTPSDVREYGTLVLRSSNVKNGEIINNDNVYVDPTIVNSENVKIGDIIIVVRNGSRALIGKHAVIKCKKSNTVIGAFMTGMRTKHPSFVNALLDTSQFEKEINKNMGATINQITGYMFSKMIFRIPTIEEQRIIGQFFSNIDNLITLHQRKCDSLQELKKGLLQRMFV